MSIYIRKDIPVEEIYKRAKQEKHAKVRARLLAIAAILEGKSRTYAAQLAGIELTNIRRWIKRFNEHGSNGLKAIKQKGKPALWTCEIEQFLKEKALQGADFEIDNRVTYRLEDFQKMIYEKFGLKLGKTTVWKKLHNLDISWISVRRLHPQTNVHAQEEFKKKSLKLLDALKNSTQTRK